MSSGKPNSSTESMLALCNHDALDLLRLMEKGEVSALEVMTSCLGRIEALNPQVNAICTLIPREDALSLAAESDKLRAGGKRTGPLHGLPIACKDLAQTRGIRTTMGSLAFKDNVPEVDSLFVERLRSAGALLIGKTNTPELGAGSHTFNEVFGTTKNPYNLQKTAGGSSGGAAAALAARMLPLADGSDMGGSLRNPAAFCNVVGFRPSVGRVPSWQLALTWLSRIGVEGPMARNVDDLGLLLSVMAGFDPRDPLAIPDSGDQFAKIPECDFTGIRIGWTPDLGMLDVAKEVQEVCYRSLDALTELGCHVEDKCPDMTGAMEVFRVLRGSYFAAAGAALLDSHGQLVKRTLAENIQFGLQLTASDLLKADQNRNIIYQRVAAYFKKFDFLVLPATQVKPFDHSDEWVTEIDGKPMGDYLDWMSICCVITICDLPAISIPCGFTEDGLPLGLQIVGKPRADMQVLQLARAFERLRPYATRLPDMLTT